MVVVMVATGTARTAKGDGTSKISMTSMVSVFTLPPNGKNTALLIEIKILRGLVGTCKRAVFRRCRVSALLVESWIKLMSYWNKKRSSTL